MEIFKSVTEVRAYVKTVKARGKSIGLVPTMGFFHEGHLSLMRTAKTQSDIVMVSVFVNPTQFGPGEDFDQYPRDMERDAHLAEGVGVDAIFVPEPAEMYPKGYCTYVQVEGLADKLCGRFRKGHFRGVSTVVLKLFNIVKPDHAYFGQKDAQQLRIIQQMVRDLNLQIEIIPVRTVREADGLAMSSRNCYLSAKERKAALAIPKSLEAAKHAIDLGARDANAVKQAIVSVLEATPMINSEYVEVSRYSDLEPTDNIEGKVLIAVAARVGKARLIDNIIVDTK